MAEPNLTREDARGRADLLTVDSYEIALDLTDGAGGVGGQTFRSRTTVRFGSRRAGASTFIDLVAERLREARLNGIPLDVSGYDPRRGIVLDGLAESNELFVDADCLFRNTGDGLHRFVDPVDGRVYLHSQFETTDAKKMYTCFDQPDLKARFTFEVTAPADWEVVTNSRAVRVGRGPGGAQVVTFAQTPPISTYITALVAGHYHKVTDSHDGIELGLYCRRSLAEYLDHKGVFEITKQGFDWYHRAFDYRYPFDKYDQLFVPEFNSGAMENAACVTVLEEHLFRSKVTEAAYERRDETLLHELAHMWFGDLVTMRWWDDLWLNESFATFASVLCQSQATKWRSAWTTFANLEKTWAYRQDQLPSTHPIAADIPDAEAVDSNFDGITYAKGASVLKQLAAYVGIDAFLDAMKVYFRRHEYGNTTLSDLLRALEETSGRDLSRWSGQWLETAGINTIRAEFEVDEHDRYTSFALLQSAPEDHNVLRDHRLAIGLYSGSPLRRVERVELDVTGERTKVNELVGMARPDLLLINDDDLTYCKLRLDDRSLVTVRDRIGELPESLPRALCWSAAWDMTRDGEMPAREYVRLVLGGIDAERDIGVVQSLHRQVLGALFRFCDPDWTSAGLRALAEKARAEMDRSEPGSDHQLAWTRALAMSARAPEHLDVLRGLLDGSVVVGGLNVDTELRWTLLRELVGVGAAGDAEIDAELDRDRTATGQRHAATARAVRPTAEAKAEAWRLATQDEEVPNAMQGAVIRGFAHPEQQDLLTPYVESYFETIGPVWQRRPYGSAQRVVVGLYPRLVDESLVDRTDAYLDAGELPAGLRRLLIEQRADLVRALNARRRDRAAAGGNPNRT